MANRAKKDASEALSQLRKYLHRDPHACQLLEALSRYQGKLRQDCAQLKTETTTLGDARGVTLLRNAALTTINQKLRLALDKEQSTTNQLRREISQLQNQIDTLDAKATPDHLEPVDDVHPDLREDTEALHTLLKAVQRRMKVAPSPCDGKPHVIHIDVRDIVTDYDSDQYQTLGMLVTLCAMLNFPVAGIWNVSDEKKHLHVVTRNRKLWEEKILPRYVRWTRRWIDWGPRWERELMQAHNEPLPKRWAGRGALSVPKGESPRSVSGAMVSDEEARP